MCVHCDLAYGTSYQRKRSRYYIGGLKNFLPRKRRGEGSPCPWVIWRIHERLGLQIEFDLCRWPIVFSYRRLRLVSHPHVKGFICGWFTLVFK